MFWTSVVSAVSGVLTSIFNRSAKKQQKITESINALEDSDDNSTKIALAKLQISNQIVKANSSNPISVFRSVALYVFLVAAVCEWFGIVPSGLDVKQLNDLWVCIISVVGITVPVSSVGAIVTSVANNATLRHIIK